MLANRLLRIAADITSEYDKFQIQQLAAASIATSQNAHQWRDDQYAAQVEPIRTRAQAILNETVLKHYPQQLRALFFKSEFSQIAPGRIAKIILAALPPTKTDVMASTELAALLAPINSKLGTLRTFVSASHSFRVEEISIPEGMISLDLLFPRELFKNDVKQSLRIQSAFVESASYLIELTSGSAGSPELVYTSTSALLVAIALLPGPAWAFIKLYDALLDVALKQVKLFEAIKTLKVATPKNPTIETLSDPVKAQIAEDVREAVNTAMKTVAPKVDDKRINEIAVKLNINAPMMMSAIIGGARVSITIESLGNAAQLTEQAHVQLERDFKEEIVERRQLEEKLAAQLDLFNSSEKPLLLNLLDPETD